jgi:hypothetical protein
LAQYISFLEFSPASNEPTHSKFGLKKKSSKTPLSDMFLGSTSKALFGTFEKKVVPCFKKLFIINYIINYINFPTFAHRVKCPTFAHREK